MEKKRNKKRPKVWQFGGLWIPTTTTTTKKKRNKKLPEFWRFGQGGLWIQKQKKTVQKATKNLAAKLG